MNASENRKDDPRGLLHPLVRPGWWVYQPSRALNEGGWERYAGPFDKEAEVREWHDVQPNKDHLRVGREVIEWEAGPNIAIAISADTREQSIAHKEEAQREIEQLERELAAVTTERDNANEKLRTISSPAVQGVLAKMAALPMNQAMDDMRKNLEILDRVKSERDELRQLLDRDVADDSDNPVGHCGCLTKSPEVHHHKKGCKYRLIMERDAEKAAHTETAKLLFDTTADRDALKEELEGIRNSG